MVVANRSSHSGASSVVVQQTMHGFDLHSWQGLTGVLKAARDAHLPDAEYNTLRDFVLQYAQSGGSQEKRILLEERLVALKSGTKQKAQSETQSSIGATRTAPEAAKQKGEEIKKVPIASQKQTPSVSETKKNIHSSTMDRFGTGRPSPRFGSADATDQLKVVSNGGVIRAQVPPVVSRGESVPPSNLPTGRLTPAVEPVVAEREVVSTQSGKPVAEKTPEMVENRNTDIHATQPLQKQVSSHVTDSAAEALDTFAGGLVSAKARIAEIKHDVNTKVGNPVMLIDEGNNIGRKYMGALLSATKALAGGPQGNLAAAMDALEDAYTQILEHARVHSSMEPGAKSVAGSDQSVTRIAPEKPTTATKSPADFHQPAAMHSDAKKKLANEKAAIPVTLEEILDGVHKRTEEKRSDSESRQRSVSSMQAEGNTEKIVSTSEAEGVAGSQVTIKENVPVKSVNAVPITREHEVVRARTKIPSVADLMQADVPLDRVVSEIKTGGGDKAQNNYPPIPPTEGVKQTIAEAVGHTPVVSIEKRMQGNSIQGSAPQRERVMPHELRNERNKNDVPVPTHSAVTTEEQQNKEHIPTVGLKQHVDMLARDSKQSTTSKPGVPPSSSSQPGEPLGVQQKELPRSSVVPVGIARNDEELMASNVTTALTELLSEWDLFKHSGLLGFGPGGTEHPLYAKLRDLHMSSVLAGRWEGANKDDLRSLKDYVSSWQYEQGVTYNPSETFEHYLRRVVFKILKRREQ